MSGVDGPELGHDPDAPWRPGYDGPIPTPCRPERRSATLPAARLRPPDPWERRVTELDPPAGFVDPADEVPADGTTDAEASGTARAASTARATVSARRRALVALASVLAVALLAAVALARGRGADDALPEIPASATELWSLDLETTSDLFAVVDTTVVVRSGDTVLALDGRTGDERWSRPSPVRAGGFGAAGATRDGLVVVVEAEGSGPGRAVALDAVSGSERWSRELTDDLGVFVFGGYPVEVRFGESGFEAVYLDATTGDPTPVAFQTADLATTWPYGVVAGDGGDEPTSAAGKDRIAVFDVERGEIVGSSVDRAGLRSLAPAGARVVGVREDGVAVLFGEDGAVVGELDVALRDGGFESAWLTSVPDTDLVILSTSAESVALEVTGDELVRTWSLAAGVFAVEDVDGGRRRAIAISEDGGIALVIDPSTGEIVHRLDGIPATLGGIDSTGVLIGRNGVIHRTAGGLVAVDHGGDELWRLDGAFTAFVADDGVLVTSDGAAVAAYG